MTDTFALRERHALCDLAASTGPDAPTLCEGWDARMLVAHLLVRENKPIASLGNVVGPLAGLNQKAMERRAAQPFEGEVAELRTPSRILRTVPPLDALINTFEMVVHHEDLRRGQPGWKPRSLPSEDLDLLWSQLSKGGKFFGRKLPVPTVVRRADTGATATLRKGADPVTVSGDVVELILFVFGRDAAHDLVFEGSDARVQALRDADLSA